MSTSFNPNYSSSNVSPKSNLTSPNSNQSSPSLSSSPISPNSSGSPRYSARVPNNSPTIPQPVRFNLTTRDFPVASVSPISPVIPVLPGRPVTLPTTGFVDLSDYPEDIVTEPAGLAEPAPKRARVFVSTPGQPAQNPVLISNQIPNQNPALCPAPSAQALINQAGAEASAPPTFSGLPTIVEYLASQPELSLLSNLVAVAGLTEQFSRSGAYTVFAPTNQALVSTLNRLGLTLNQLLSQPGTIIRILGGHILNQPISMGMVFCQNGTVASNLNQQRLIIEPNRAGDGFTVAVTVASGVVRTANILAPDILCQNGIIDVIDQVLV